MKVDIVADATVPPSKTLAISWPSKEEMVRIGWSRMTGEERAKWLVENRRVVVATNIGIGR